MYPITPTKLNAATITMANMAAPLAAASYLYLTRPRSSGRYHYHLIADYFFPGAPRVNRVRKPKRQAHLPLGVT
jgi:hypothetical protein